MLSRDVSLKRAKGEQGGLAERGWVLTTVPPKLVGWPRLGGPVLLLIEVTASPTVYAIEAPCARILLSGPRTLLPSSDLISTVPHCNSEK